MGNFIVSLITTGGSISLTTTGSLVSLTTIGGPMLCASAGNSIFCSDRQQISKVNSKIHGQIHETWWQMNQMISPIIHRFY
jgi:hypothetical protein